MSRYNGLFRSFFHGCAIVGTMRDEGRGREITAYAIEGEPEVVGYYDGTDTWVGSAITMPKELLGILREVHGGAAREIEYGQTRRRMHDAPGVMGSPQLPLFGAPRARKRATADAAPTPRKRAVVDDTPPPLTAAFFEKPIVTAPGESLVANVRRERRRAQ